MKIIITLFLALGLFVSCKESTKSNKGVIQISSDSCYDLINKDGEKISAFRNMRIIENTFSDSIVVGFAVIPKGYVGEITYLRQDTTVDKSIYPQSENEDLPKTNSICLNKYQGKEINGFIKIEYEYLDSSKTN